jgi:hypothetical protein
MRAGRVPDLCRFDSNKFSCVIPCVIYVSRKRGESGKKREYMTHLKYKRHCKSIIYKVC